MSSNATRYPCDGIRVTKSGAYEVFFYCPRCGCEFALTQKYMRDWPASNSTCPECGEVSVYKSIEPDYSKHQAPKMYERLSSY